jgi:MoxR-like ATPase
LIVTTIAYGGTMAAKSIDKIALHPQLHPVVERIANNYFIDPKVEQVGSHSVEYWTTLMSLFTYIGNKNAIFLGNHGTGKTTCSGVISAVMTGLPYDLFDSLKIQGHPDQTKDTMIARADLGRLAEEGVVWQASMFLPALTFDEFNRLPPGKQNIVMEYVRTGRAEHLGKVLRTGKKPFFATMNYNGAGTYPLTPPMQDRFHLSLEFPLGPSFLQGLIQDASERVETELSDPDLATELNEMLLKKDITPKDKLVQLAAAGAKSGYKAVIDGAAILAAANKLQFSPDAATYQQCIWDEINQTFLYGDKRSVDPVDMHEHNKKFANRSLKESISARAWGSIEFYSRMLAVYMGHDEVDIVHISAVAPHCLAHRLEFHSDFADKFTTEPRLYGERRELDLSRRMLREVKKNYDDIAPDLKTMDNALALSREGRSPTGDALRRVRDICNGPEPDHPLFKAYWKELKPKFGR